MTCVAEQGFTATAEELYHLLQLHTFPTFGGQALNEIDPPRGRAWRAERLAAFLPTSDARRLSDGDKKMTLVGHVRSFASSTVTGPFES